MRAGLCAALLGLSALAQAADVCVQRAPTACVNDTGTGSRAWTNPTRAFGSDNSYATAAVTGTTQTNYLRCSGYGFALPAGAVPTSIRLGAERFGGGAAFRDHQVRLVKANAIQASNFANASTWPSTDPNTTDWHNASVSGFTQADINATGFGQAFAADKAAGSPQTASVDALPIEVCYSVAAAPYLRLVHPTGAGLSCAADSVTIQACTDASCSSPYTFGVSGTLTSSGGSVVWAQGVAFSIPVGSSSVTRSVQLTSAGSTVLGVTATTPALAAPLTCRFGSPGCTYSAAAAGFVLGAPAHRSDGTVTLSVRAVRQSDSSPACLPAFASVTRTLAYGCGYTTPATGTFPARLNNQGLNPTGSTTAACSGSRGIATAFDASGQASLSLRYADVGRLALTANYSGSAATNDTGLTMSGSTSVVVAPDTLVFNSFSTGVRSAGLPFAAVVSARNTSNITTPNFGREGESISLSLLRRSPTGTAAVDGVFTTDSPAPAAVAGVLSYSALVWSEVGQADLQATLASGNYLGSGLGATGSTGSTTGAVGPFRPHHLAVAASGACGGTFSYAAQPFNVTLTARNAQGATTRNYDGSTSTAPNWARVPTFSDANRTATVNTFATLAPTTWALSLYRAGVATGTLALNFNAKQAGPAVLKLRASDSDGVTSQGAPAPALEPDLPTRSGRLGLASAAGSATQPLTLPLRLESWVSGAWTLEAADTCTVLPTSAVVQSGRTGPTGAAATFTSPVQAVLPFVNGQGGVRLSPPTPTQAGSVAVAINLGATTPDRACLPARPPSTGANLPWLRSRWGVINGCNANRWDSDPSATASFGLSPGESQRRVYERQAY